MLIRNICKNRFVNRFFTVIYYKYNLISILRYPKYAVKNVPLAASKYFSLAVLNFMLIAETQSSNKDKDKDDENEKINLLETAISQSDEFFLIGKFRDSWKVLMPFKDSENVEILWRLSRALYNLSKEMQVTKSEKASLIKEAYNYIDRALTLNKNHFAVHKWMAILYDAKSDLEGMKARIQALPVFKEHLKKAVELNPKDATSIHMLGQYMYNIADMSWLQKNIAKAFFGTPPEATFEEAFYYFIRAEEVEPNFYSANLLMLGKTCLKLKKIEAARYWLKCAIAYPVRTDEDEAVRLEAEELLKKHPMVNPAEGQEKSPDIQ